jgi:hypothetical protein
MKTQKQPCRKKKYEKVTFELKLFVVGQMTIPEIGCL